MLTPVRCCALLLLASLLFPAAAEAQINWIGGTNNWSTVPSWDPANVPDTAGEDASITNGSTVTVDGSFVIGGLTVGAADTVMIDNVRLLALNGDVNNDGLIELLGSVNATALRPDTSLSLGGSGVLQIGDTGVNLNVNLIGASNAGVGAVLTNTASHTIRSLGPGSLGRGTTGIVNAGLIESTGPGGALTISTASTLGGLVNTGTVRGNGGVVTLFGDTDNTGGIIEGVSGGEVQLSTGAVTGGKLRGALSVVSTVDVADLTNTGSIALNNSRRLDTSGTITNDGTITLEGTVNGTPLQPDASTTFAGTGEVVIGPDGANANVNLIGASSTGVGATLTNAADHTVRATGPGTLGRATTGIVNDGLIVAEGAAASLLVNPNASLGGLDNNGVVSAASGGVVTLQAVTDNTGGVIEGVSGGEVQLNTGTAVTGGEFRGALRVVGLPSIADLTNTGSIVVDNSRRLITTGAITNNGTITLEGTVTGTPLQLEASTTFAGTGQIVIGPGGANTNVNVIGASSTGVGATLTNTADHTIRAIGIGTLGRQTTGVVNDGLIVAEGADGSLLVNPNATLGGLDNNNVLRAAGGGVVTLQAVTDNTGGVIEGVSGGEVQLSSGTDITGGELRGALRVVGIVNLTDLANTGSIFIDNNRRIDTSGTLTNNGTITLGGATAITAVQLSDNTTFTGAGELVISPDGANININQIGSSTVGVNATLFNGANHTIRALGIGNLGRNTTALANEGLIIADGPTADLTIDTASSFADNFNDGVIRANDGGRVFFQDSLEGGGAIEAIGPNSRVERTNSASQVIEIADVKATDGGSVEIADSTGGDVDLRINDNRLEFTGQSFTDIFAAGPNGSFGGVATTAGDLRSNQFIQNNGTFTIGDGLDFIANAPAAAGDENTGTIIVGGGSVFAMGQFTIDGGFGEPGDPPPPSPVFDGVVPFRSTGTLAGAGTIANANGPTLELLAGGGIGFNDEADLISAGVIAPGEAPGETAGLRLAGRDVVLEATNELQIEIGFAGADNLEIVTDSGFTVDLAGELSVSLLEGFTPEAGDTFTILTSFEGFTGTFDTETLPTLDDCLLWRVNYNPTSVVLEVILPDFIPGDFNDDGRVDNSDLNLLLANWGSTTLPPEWTSGFIGPAVDNDELNDLLAKWGFGVGAAAVPEPAAGVLGMLAVVGLVGRRPRLG